MSENTEIKEKITGKIIKLHQSGWGFVISEEIKFTKFFFHWTGLTTSTKKFTELKVGMKVKFIPLNLNEVEVEGIDKKGERAIQIEVI